MLVFLIGFMGSGKSYTGNQLSVLLNMPFMDMDEEIEAQEQMSITDIFEAKGEPYFRELEHNFLRNLGSTDSTIIATGGGAPCHHDHMTLMNSIGTTIFLDTPKEEIIHRLQEGQATRPLLKGMNEWDLGFFYDRKMAARRPFYELAHFHVKHQDAEVLAQLISQLQ